MYANYLRQVVQYPLGQRRLIAPIFVTVTLGIVMLFQFSSLWSHDQTTGDWNAPPAEWPRDSALPGKTGTIRIVLFAHPQCPCTRASLSELERVIARSSKEASVCVVFYQPHSLPRSWTESGAWRMAVQIPGIDVVADEGGVETRRFHAATSGVTAVYGVDNRLLFAGGITSSRGHEGGNAGTDALFAALSEQTLLLKERCVYGCPIFARSPAP
jgi:hypothetical protein